MMLKLKLVYGLFIIGVIPLVIPLRTTAQGCTNYWVNPQTGKEECFGTGSLPVKPTQQESDEHPGYVKITENRNGDKIYIKTNSIIPHKYGRTNSVVFRVISFYGKKDFDGTVKTSTSYLADCNANTLSTIDYTKYDISNQIINSIRYNSPTANRYQSTEPYSMQVVQTGTVGFSIWNYVCSNQ
jgi:hypothetical protein